MENITRVGLIALFSIGILLIILSIIVAVSDIPFGNSPSPESAYTQIPNQSVNPGRDSLNVSRTGPVPVMDEFRGPAGPEGHDIQIRTTDLKSGSPLGGVSVFINGQPRGISSDNGTLNLLIAGSGSNISTIRAVKDGYTEKTVQINPDSDDYVTIDLAPTGIIPIEINGPPESKIDVVFLPSDTSFNGTTNTKIMLGGYPGGQQQFESDVRRFIADTVWTYPAKVSPWYPLPRDYQERFNFYYFWDGRTYADAFDGCSGTIPKKYWQEVTFSDLSIILYPSYQGRYLGPPAPPAGCTNPNGLGGVYLKVAADTPKLGIHEIGHGLYGLLDTYCSNSLYYTENDPNPNVWNSMENCQAYARANSWNPDACTQISGGEPAPCTVRFWRWDPDPDIMDEWWAGTFGNASSKRILTIINHI